MQKKSCSNCNTQVFVACRSCPTCKQPFPKTGAIARIMSEYEGLFRRRTERIKREKPNYYDASAFSNRKNPKKTTTKKEDKTVAKEKQEKSSNKKSTNSSSKDTKKEKEPPPSSSLPPPTTTQTSKDESKDSSPKPRRKKLMKTKVSKDTEEETYNSIMNTQQSAQQCNVILAELNRKLFLTSWRGI
ncbi:hypothetical protein M8J75_013059 [Diaphorina citri]|nr:hypothetical protein M8J75_013059 [Diaphorina citri]